MNIKKHLWNHNLYDTSDETRKPIWLKDMEMFSYLTHKIHDGICDLPRMRNHNAFFDCRKQNADSSPPCNSQSWPKLYPETILHHERLASMAASSMFFARLTSTEAPQRNPASYVGPATNRTWNCSCERVNMTCLHWPCPVSMLSLWQSYILSSWVLELGWVCLKQVSNELPNKFVTKKRWKHNINFRISTSTNALQHLWAFSWWRMCSLTLKALVGSFQLLSVRPVGCLLHFAVEP